MMSNNYLLVYDDLYSLTEKIKELTQKEFSTAEFTTYDLEEKPLESALENLDTYSLLGNKKVIHIKNIAELKDDDNTAHLLKYLDNPSPDNLLILSTPKLNLTKKINKTIKNKTTYIKLESDLNSTIKSLLKGYSLETGVITQIIDYSNSNIDIITQECNKLKEYKYDTKDISKKDVQAIVLKRLKDSSQLVFDLVREIICENKVKALKIYNELEDYNVDDIALIGLLESELRIMNQVWCLKNKNMTNKQISETLNKHPYRIQKIAELFSYTTIEEVSQLIQNLCDIDYKIKSGQISNELAIFIYIINLKGK